MCKELKNFKRFRKYGLTRSAAETESFFELTSLDDADDDEEVAEDTLNMLRKDATGAILLLTSLFFVVFNDDVTLPPSVTSLSEDSSYRTSP